VSYRVHPANIDEQQHPDEDGPAFALRTARDKALAVSRLEDACPVLGSDTVVEINGVTLGKPASREDAAEMLRGLSNEIHRVHTGLALAVGGRCEAVLDSASVRFRELSEETIRWYVATGEPMDKAGAYAIQGGAADMVQEIEGSYSNVVGLPVERILGELRRRATDCLPEVSEP